jgi:hypothetical protein
MNKDTMQLISTLEALFSNQVKMAEAHGLETLPHISTARAREILTQLRIEKAKAKTAKPNNSFFDHLDKIHA